VDQLAACLHALLAELDVDRPVVVGHSFGAAVASMYAAQYPTLGLVMIDSGPEQQTFSELVHRAAPALRGPGFDDAWTMIEASLGLELIPQPVQELVRTAHRVDQAVLLGYWAQLLTSPPPEFQAYVDTFFSRIDVPALAIYGHPASPGDRQRFETLPDVRVEEYPGEGHFLHLVNPTRSAASLRQFVADCTTAA
jgi:pimeloyl-ACP methyl ester carboxylesterase